MKKAEQSETTNNRSKVLDCIEARLEFIPGDDGFYIWWPKGYIYGAFTSNNLREIADELDRKNKEWEAVFNANQ